MYSTRSVGSCFQGTRRGVGQSPGPCSGVSSGPVRNRTWLAMYSAPAVECVSCCLKGTDEGLVRGLYGALPLSYSAVLKVALVGLEPTTPGS